MAHRRFVLLGIAGVIVLVVGIAVTSLGENLTYYLYPTEAVSQRPDFPDGERFRLAGTVVSGTFTESEDEVTFEVTDGGATIPVVLTEAAPDLLTEGVPVLLEGAWSGYEFVADDVLIRHDENYVTPEQGGAYPAN